MSAKKKTTCSFCGAIEGTVFMMCQQQENGAAICSPCVTAAIGAIMKQTEALLVRQNVMTAEQAGETPKEPPATPEPPLALAPANDTGADDQNETGTQPTTGEESHV